MLREDLTHHNGSGAILSCRVPLAFILPVRHRRNHVGSPARTGRAPALAGKPFRGGLCGLEQRCPPDAERGAFQLDGTRFWGRFYPTLIRAGEFFNTGSQPTTHGRPSFQLRPNHKHRCVALWHDDLIVTGEQDGNSSETCHDRPAPSCGSTSQDGRRASVSFSFHPAMISSPSTWWLPSPRVSRFAHWGEGEGHAHPLGA